MTAPLREQSFTVSNAYGDVVHGDVRYLDEGRDKPVIVFCHGFKGFKDWGPFPAWGRRLAASGFVSVLFNFSHNGVAPEQPTQFTELDKFADNTFTRELDDLRAVLDAVTGNQLVDVPIDADRVGLMGHSRGGGTAILQAARDRRIRALATWSAVAGFIERFSTEQIEDWTTQGYTEVVNSRTGQRMRLNRVLYDNARAHRDELDITAAAATIDIPWLIVHARDDQAVPFAEAKQLLAASEDAELVEADGGHTFGGAHPFADEVPASLNAVWERTIHFFETHFVKQGAAW